MFEAWIELAAASGMFLSCYYVLTGILADDYEREYGNFAMVSGLVSVVWSAIYLWIVVFHGIGSWYTHPRALLTVLLAGCLYHLAIIPFYSAYKYADTHSIAVMAQLMPLIIMFFSWVSLREKMTPGEMVASFVTIGGCLYAVIQGEIKESIKAVICVLVALLFSCSSYVVVKYARNAFGVNGFDVFFVGRLSVILNTIIMLGIPKVRKDLLGFFSIGKKGKRLFFTNELLINGMNLLALMSIALQPAGKNTGLVSVIYYGLCQAVLAVWFLARKKEGTLHRVIGATVALGGLIYLVTMPK